MSNFWYTVLTVLIAIGFFELIIFVHEFGHFIVAKMCGVRVNEFALGMGPKLIKFKGKETLYSLRLFPIGGFCAMEGETEDSDDEKSFSRKAPWRRLLIVSAGAVMNILLGLIIMFALLSREGYLIGSTTVAGFQDENVSSQYGLMQGDVIKRINGMRIFTYRDISTAMSSDDDGVMDFVVERDGEEHDLTIKFNVEEVNGVDMVIMDFKLYAVEKTPWTIIKHAFGETVSMVRAVLISLADIITGRYALTDLSGPVGTVTVISQAVSVSFDSLLFLMAFITINVGVFNLLPVPALDGSKNIFILIEMIFKKKVPEKWETIITAVGFILLLALIAFVTVNDVINLDRYKLT